jgi:hypothetical protein
MGLGKLRRFKAHLKSLIILIIVDICRINDIINGRITDIITGNNSLITSKRNPGATYME